MIKMSHCSTHGISRHETITLCSRCIREGLLPDDITRLIEQSTRHRISRMGADFNFIHRDDVLSIVKAAYQAGLSHE